MINPVELHPRTWQQLQSRRDRLPHALLLSGPRGLGKFALAQTFIAGLLCERGSVDGLACGKCLACGWQAQGHHPDFRLLQPEALGESEKEGEEGKKKGSKQITIEQVRDLDTFLNIGTHRAGLRVVLIYPAEAMNRHTANALLKSLEEPSNSTLFLLVSDEPMRLLPTIRSRCQSIALPLPEAARAADSLRSAGVADPTPWLALAGGAPILAYELAQAGQDGWLSELVRRLANGKQIEPLGAALALDKSLKESKGKLSLGQIVDWVQKWSVDLVLARNRLPVRYFVRHEATIASIVANVPEIRLLHFYQRLLAYRREAEQPLNARLFLDAFFLNYRALFT